MCACVYVFGFFDFIYIVKKILNLRNAPMTAPNQRANRDSEMS